MSYFLYNFASLLSKKDKLNQISKMQYDNKSDVEKRRVVAKVIGVVLTILLILPVFGQFPVLLYIWLPLLFLLLMLLVFATSGALDIMYISIGNGNVDVRVSPFFSTSKHRRRIVSTESENICGYSYQRVLFLRKFTIRYQLPDASQPTKVTLWITLMGKRRRHELCNCFHSIITQNKRQQQ